ncbi:helix-turn-helix domain-containing protein [Pseudoduganella umbonata]|nr:helix-turn-helix transcriptional regulator [Pseudoduganella umbonata]
MLRLLREERLAAGLSQEQLATRLQVTQVFVSKCERGQRRIDPVELRTWCMALGTTGARFYEAFEEAALKNEILLGKKS